MNSNLSPITHNLKNKGQSLLEVTILVGLALVTISGLVIVTVNGLKNSQYSQNQAQATKLAQEGMDQIKSIAQRNCAASVGGSFFWFNSQNGTGSDLVWGQDWHLGPTFRISNYNGCNQTTAGLTQSAQPDIDPAVTGGIFTRTITISDDASCTPTTSCKVVTVSVAWNDYSGNHESRLATILTEN